ncbi:hypothetical protein DUNSADRAFT_842 [Dunaliella salina]|uniref:Encoded protein n=1 Tax=Dunaliella salina TaxID=3046 RepID=A0ABQ7FYA5_DUNSA|nr:hypothetical protein DUNSADRAFT_842 [Dunaliella salina]|eukprot:KAF5827340.1 hypothetical protein DUNSADRAFT_842 [Dunaliella salina]
MMCIWVAHAWLTSQLMASHLMADDHAARRYSVLLVSGDDGNDTRMQHDAVAWLYIGPRTCLFLFVYLQMMMGDDGNDACVKYDALAWLDIGSRTYDDGDDTRTQLDASSRGNRGTHQRWSKGGRGGGGVTYGDGGVAGRLQVLSNFQVAPLLQYWQTKTGAQPGAGSWNPSRTTAAYGTPPRGTPFRGTPPQVGPEHSSSNGNGASISNNRDTLRALQWGGQQQPPRQQSHPDQDVPSQGQQDACEMSAMDWLGLGSLDDSDGSGGAAGQEGGGAVQDNRDAGPGFKLDWEGNDDRGSELLLKVGGEASPWQ